MRSRCRIAAHAAGDPRRHHGLYVGVERREHLQCCERIRVQDVGIRGLESGGDFKGAGC